MRYPSPTRKTCLPAIALITALVATILIGCSAAALGKPSLATQVKSSVSSGSVSVRLIDGTAVLTGRVMSTYDLNAAVRAATRYEGVERVENHIYVVR